ncbi:hypothetical protein AKO1_015552 [Acrasis kona]|uniref:Uncharacterized protein n=1 Tax=Acrasis kona TaxID=1008807 RepID=A0AAW2ZG91_9EUKA
MTGKISEESMESCVVTDPFNNEEPKENIKIDYKGVSKDHLLQVQKVDKVVASFTLNDCSETTLVLEGYRNSRWHYLCKTKVNKLNVGKSYPYCQGATNTFFLIVEGTEHKEEGNEFKVSLRFMHCLYGNSFYDKENGAIIKYRKVRLVLPQFNQCSMSFNIRASVSQVDMEIYFSEADKHRKEHPELYPDIPTENNSNQQPQEDPIKSSKSRKSSSVVRHQEKQPPSKRPNISSNIKCLVIKPKVMLEDKDVACYKERADAEGISDKILSLSADNGHLFIGRNREEYPQIDLQIDGISQSLRIKIKWEGEHVEVELGNKNGKRPVSIRRHLGTGFELKESSKVPFRNHDAIEIQLSGTESEKTGTLEIVMQDRKEKLFQKQ